ncbi:hypothetical protein MPNT_40098 [Candidatus Methylacidithermus pantelleriae]|uniref:Uncharacterized protein n=1 Tax=Candidatus Methylacidithermus pantelleriae TaxID=2744239 RepID=A0A8J2FWT4_9BACT|nr:hypothetical protein MPNT_40098 [Candidatus Methylacidithermus pantelleriae]
MDRFDALGEIRGIRLNLHGKSEKEAEAMVTDAYKKVSRALRRGG